MNKKKILILGGNTHHIVKVAQQMGLYVVVASNQDSGDGKKIADEALMISTTDLDSLEKYIKGNKISGVFSGPSEFHLEQVMKLCKRVGLPFYATEEQWNIATNKALFKQLCRQYGVPHVKEFKINSNFEKDSFKELEYPVIVKPVDSCSSKGITVCFDQKELYAAFDHALHYSATKELIVEKYLQSEFYTSSRYVACDGNLYLSLVGDVYILDPFNRTSLISSVSIYPSKNTNLYITTVNDKVIAMMQGLGVKNGSFFFQMLPEDNHLYIYEMGLRLSGGLLYKITEPATGINDLKMMLRYSVGEKMCTEEDIGKFDPFLNGKLAGSIAIPLKTGRIKKIEGYETILGKYDIIDIHKHYNIGDEIKSEYIGTLQQQLCTIDFFADNINHVIEILNFIQNSIKVYDCSGNSLIYMRFDTDRIKTKDYKL